MQASIDAIVAAVDFAPVGLGIGSIAANLAIAYIAFKAAKMLLNVLR